MIGKTLAVVMFASGVGMIASALTPQPQGCYEDEPCWTEQHSAVQLTQYRALSACLALDIVNTETCVREVFK